MKKCAACKRPIDPDAVYVILARAGEESDWFHWYHAFAPTPERIALLKKRFPAMDFNV